MWVNHLLVVEDQALLRQALCAYLAKALGTTIGEAGSGTEALAQLRRAPWDVVLLDIGLGDISGVDVLKAAKAEQSCLAVIMLTLFNEAAVVRRCFRLGAAGFVTKDDFARDVLTAIQAAQAGRCFISPGVRLAQVRTEGLVRLVPSERL